MEEYKSTDNINFEKEGLGWGTFTLSEIRKIIKHCNNAIEIDKIEPWNKIEPLGIEPWMCGYLINEKGDITYQWEEMDYLVGGVG